MVHTTFSTWFLQISVRFSSCGNHSEEVGSSYLEVGSLSQYRFCKVMREISQKVTSNMEGTASQS